VAVAIFAGITAWSSVLTGPGGSVGLRTVVLSLILGLGSFAILYVIGRIWRWETGAYIVTRIPPDLEEIRRIRERHEPLRDVRHTLTRTAHLDDTVWRRIRDTYRIRFLFLEGTPKKGAHGQ